MEKSFAWILVKPWFCWCCRGREKFVLLQKAPTDRAAWARGIPEFALRALIRRLLLPKSCFSPAARRFSLSLSRRLLLLRLEYVCVCVVSFVEAERDWDAYIDYWMREYCCVTLLWIMLPTKTMQMAFLVCVCGVGDIIIGWRTSTACGGAATAPTSRRTKTFQRKVGTAEKQRAS